jgi:predicted metalloendopeptidase
MSEQMGRLEGPQALRVATFGDRFGPGMFTMTIAQDRHRTGRNALYLGQGGIMLPDPSYYSRENLADIKTAYDLGANSYVVKPVDFESFMKTMGELGFYWLAVNQVPL